MKLEEEEIELELQFQLSKQLREVELQKALLAEEEESERKFIISPVEVPVAVITEVEAEMISDSKCPDVNSAQCADEETTSVVDEVLVDEEQCVENEEHFLHSM